MSAPLVTVASYTRLPERAPLDLQRDVDARRTNVEVETQLNGGYGLARVGMLAPDAPRPLVAPALPRPQRLQERAHVEVSIGGHLLHEGVLWSAEGDEAFTAAGYGLFGPWEEAAYAQADAAAADAILRETIRRYAPLAAVAGDFAGPGTAHAWNEFDGRTAVEILEQLTTEGDGAFPYAWTIYGGRRLRVFRLDGAAPRYRLPYDRRLIAASRDYQGAYDAVRVRYQDAAGADRLTAWAYAAGADPAGVAPRRATIDGGQLSATAAERYARTWIAANGGPALSATVTIPEWGDLPLAGGGAAPAYLARAGEALRIEGYGTGSITRTQANLTTGVTTLQIGDPPADSFAGQLRRMQAGGEALRAGLAPATRARARR